MGVFGDPAAGGSAPAVDVKELHAKIGQYLFFYNSRRPHSSVGGRTPDAAYGATIPEAMAA